MITDASGGSASSEADAVATNPVLLSEQVNKQFAKMGPEEFGRKVDRHISTTEPDDQWSPAALVQIQGWFRDSFPDQNSVVASECVADVCYIDVTMSAIDLAMHYGEAGREWANDPAPGFLSANVAVAGGNNFFRIYMFRDSFDVLRL